jgi:hypothetical protein
MIRASKGMSDLLFGAVDARSTSANVPVGGGFVMGGVETLVARRIDSPFVQQVENGDSKLSRWYEAIRSRLLRSNIAVPESQPSNQNISSIPMAPIRRIENVFIQQKRPSTVLSGFIDAISSLFTRTSDVNQSSDRSHYSEVAGVSSNAEIDLDVLLSGMQSISLGSSSLTQRSNYTNAQPGFGNTASPQAYHRAHLGQYPVQSLSPGYHHQVNAYQYSETEPHVDIDVEMRDVSTDPLPAPRSAIKGARPPSLFSFNSHRFNRVKFTHHDQVQFVPNWIDRERDIQMRTKEPVSAFEDWRFRNSVGWLESEKREGRM